MVKKMSKKILAVVMGFSVIVTILTGCQSESSPSEMISPDRIVFTSARDGNQEIYVMNPDGTDQTRLTYSPPTAQDPLGVDADPAWSLDGKKIAFMSTRTGDGEIWFMNADGTNVVNLTNDSTTWDLEPEWSPDGKKIVYISSEISPGGGVVEDTAEIFVINVDGTNRIQLTHNNYTDAYPVFSPNGQLIVFHSDKGKIPIGECNVSLKGVTTIYANELYVMDNRGDNVVQLTDTGDRSNRAFSWSPDGTRLVYTSNKDCEPSDIYTIDVGNLQYMDLGSLKDKSVEELQQINELGHLTIERLTANPSGPDTNPSFSLDGTRIVFQSIRQGVSGGPDLFVMNADGSDIFRITNNTYVEKDPDWMR